jgi:putative hydrolase of the HAD superfamily
LQKRRIQQSELKTLNTSTLNAEQFMPDNKIKTLIFDWGDTIMRDYGLPGPMAHWEKVDWIPGAEKALKILSKKYTCTIATSADHSGTAEMIAALTRVGAEKYFHHFFSSQEIGFKKPDPGFFDAIAKKLSLDPSACVMIGNFYEKDIVGAKQAGMQTVWFNETQNNDNFNPESYPDADHIIFAMEQLPDIIP